MRTYGWAIPIGLVVSTAMLASCTGATSEPATEPASPGTQTAVEWCAEGADRVIDRLQVFLAGLPDVSIEDFLSLDEVDGLTSFQNDVAAIIAETTDQNSTLCDLDGLQDLVAERLDAVEREGLLSEYLIATVRDGRELTTADLVVNPGDDVESVLNLLDDGSTLTFTPGVYELQRPLLVIRSISLLGEAGASTTLTSTAGDAAIVVVGRGELIMRNLQVEHVGTAVASVVLSFDRPVDLLDVHLSGGVADDEGGAGNGLVLTDETVGGAASTETKKPRSVVASTVVAGNAGAGIAISGALEPQLEDLEISENGVCGICFFGTASGDVRSSLIHENDFGIQIGDAATPRIVANTISANATAGMVVLGEAAPVVEANTFEDNEEVAIAVQESAAPMISDNVLQQNPFGISVLSAGSVVVRGNTVIGGEIGIQVDEDAAPRVENNQFRETLAVAVAITGRAGGSYLDNTIEVGEGVGVVVDAEAAPTIDGLTVTSGEVAVAYSGAGNGSLSNGRFSEQGIGIQLDDQAYPEISLVTMTDLTSAGIVARGAVAAVIHEVRIVDVGEVGFALADTTEVVLEQIEVVGGLTGGSIIGMSTATVRSSVFSDTEVGIQIGEQAMPTLFDNEVIGATSAAFVYVGESGGTAEGNRIREPGVVGIQLGEMARPSLDANVLFLSRPAAESESLPEGPATDEQPELGAGATVGILYAGETAGTASNNQIVGFVIGVQVGETSTPEIIENTIDGGVLLGVGVLFRDEAGGTARGNTTSAHTVGFQVSDSAMPLLDSNTVVTASNVAFLVQGEADPVLTNNVCPEGLAGIGLLNGTDPERVNNQCVDVLGAG